MKTLVNSHSSRLDDLHEEQLLEDLDQRSDHPVTSDDTTTFVGSDLAVRDIHVFLIPWMERCVPDHKLFDLVK